MKIERLNNSGTMRQYRITALDNSESETLNNMRDEALYDLVESFNYGGAIQHRHEHSVTFRVYLD